MSKKEELLKVAEVKVRQGGYNNFSFREIANEVGIKSASVHYHFPTKADLGAELAHQYTDAFLGALGDVDDIKARGENPIDVYTQLFRGALLTDDKMCLGGLLGAQNASLPEKVQTEVKRFFVKNLTWLQAAHKANGAAITTPTPVPQLIQAYTRLRRPGSVVIMTASEIGG